MPKDAIASYLAWDSDFFGYRIARANHHQLTSEENHELEEWCTREQIDCLYFLADSNHSSTIKLLEQHSYQFVDIRLTFDRSTDIVKPSSLPHMILRLSSPADSHLLSEISSRAYIQSRFYADSCFSDADCSRLYQVWLKNSIETDYADAVVVAEISGVPVGYVTCHLNKPDGEGSIGLVGIAESARGRQLGQHIVNHAINWFAEQSMNKVNVVTQGRNISAQRLYQRCGFVTRSVQLWYHRWFTNCG